MLFAGRNPSLDIVRAQIDIEGYSYEIDVPEREVFMKIIPVDNTLGYLSSGETVISEETNNDSAAVDVSNKEKHVFQEWKLAEMPLVRVFNNEGIDVTE